MRTLSSQEINQVDQRLESLKIQYLEIYHEIRDHYFTELEKKPVEEFETTFQQLNETFSISLVKNMQRKLKSTSAKRVKQMQWEILKFWKFSNPDFYVAPATLLVIALIYNQFGFTGISLTVGIVSLIGIPFSWNAVSEDLHISVRKFSGHFDKALSHEIFDKSGIFISGLYWIYIAVNNSSPKDNPIIASIIIWTIVTCLLLYMVTLIKVAMNWKKRKTCQLI
jgi:hypothetical protein